MNPLERQRRELKATDPGLYSYIACVEQTRAYDQAGDLASGASTGEGAANRLWQRASILRQQLDGLARST
jgi:hypothetical protein